MLGKAEELNYVNNCLNSNFVTRHHEQWFANLGQEKRAVGVSLYENHGSGFTLEEKL